ncbi:MAG: hypothetical protein LBM01_01745 [Christensenellaceae bacterium]|jgi:hypothetical protein|nr:hypothetical protein [Christensenellaceae bacterium]
MKEENAQTSKPIVRVANGEFVSQTDEQKAEKTNKKLKKKLLIALLLLLLLLAIVGITVWATNWQRLNLENEITIIADPGIFVDVTVSEAVGPTDKAILNATLSSDNLKDISGQEDATEKLIYTPKVQMSSGDKGDAGNGGDKNKYSAALTNRNFSYENGFAYVAYKFEFKNTGNHAAYYSLTPTKPNTNQLIYYYITGAGSQDSDGDILTGNLIKDQTVTFYVVLAVDGANVEGMFNLKEMSSTNQKIEIVFTKAAGQA